MSDVRATLEHLLQRRDLSEAGAAALLRELTAPGLAPAMGGALLAAMRSKGITADELRGFAGGMRELARKPLLAASADAVDIVGTGGDASGSLNLSTGAALLAAACGLPVIKHGNRSISSRSGSADLIEALGVSLPLEERSAARCFAATGFTFLFAPYFHPAMRALAPIRAALGVRTLFNVLGPLTNPAAPRYMLVGAYDTQTAELLAGALAGMQIERAWVVHGAAGWDEATPIGPFTAYEVAGESVQVSRVDPEDLGLARCRPQDLVGGDATYNLAALQAVFAGHDRGAHASALLLQAGLALRIAGRCGSIDAGIARARQALESGDAQRWLVRLQHFAAENRGAAVDPSEART